MLLFNVIMFALVEIPIVAYLVDPEHAAAVVNDMAAWGRRHARTIALVVAVATGVWLVTRGIVELV